MNLDEDRFGLTGPSDLTIDKVLSAPTTEDEKTKLQEAEEFILESLAGGEESAWKELLSKNEEGHTEQTLRRARSELKKKGKVVRLQKGKSWKWKLNNDEQMNKQRDVTCSEEDKFAHLFAHVSKEELAHEQTE